MADHHLRIPGFLGLMQYGDGVNADARFCTECENASSAEGSLGPVADCEHLGGDLPDPIETLARLHRRYHTTDQERDVLIAAAGGQLYWRLPAGEKWQRIPLPAEWTAEEYQCSRFSCVSYEINPEGSSAPVDVLIMSNAKDGMLSDAFTPMGKETHRLLLEMEGITFTPDGRVEMEKYFWAGE